jgi:hypothetical protein
VSSDPGDIREVSNDPGGRSSDPERQQRRDADADSLDSGERQDRETGAQELEGVQAAGMQQVSASLGLDAPSSSGMHDPLPSSGWVSQVLPFVRARALSLLLSLSLSLSLSLAHLLSPSYVCV